MRRGGALAAIVAASLCVGGPLIGNAASAATRPPNVIDRLGGMAALRSRVHAIEAHISGQLRPAVDAHAAPVPTMTVHDVEGDADYSQGDLVGAGMLQNSSGTTFGVTVVSPANPNADPNWIADQAGVIWLVDSNSDDIPDFLIDYEINNGTFQAPVINFASGTLRCLATPEYIANVGYRVFVPATCLPHFTTVRFLATMAYEFTPITEATLFDQAPDLDFSVPTNVQQPVVRKPPPVVHSNGYWMLGADGHVYAFGSAKGFSGFVAGAVAMAPRADGRGYWVVDRAGHVFTYGTALFYGGSPPLGAGEFVSTISATPTGGGYWLFTNKGRAFPFGNARSFGDMSGTVLNGPIVASVATPTGGGYYMVGSDGGIFTFGDARFHGSTGGIHLNKPVVGISPTPDTRGYWLVATDGGVFAFGAPFRGSMGAAKLNRPVDGLVAFGNGYLMAASDGGIFDFSNKPFEGSLAEHPPTAPIIGVAAYST